MKSKNVPLVIKTVAFKPRFKLQPITMTGQRSSLGIIPGPKLVLLCDPSVTTPTNCTVLIAREGDQVAQDGGMAFMGIVQIGNMRGYVFCDCFA